MRLCAQRNSCPKRTEWNEDLINTNILPPTQTAKQSTRQSRGLLKFIYRYPRSESINATSLSFVTAKLTNHCHIQRLHIYIFAYDCCEHFWHVGCCFVWTVSTRRRCPVTLPCDTIHTPKAYKWSTAWSKWRHLPQTLKVKYKPVTSCIIKAKRYAISSDTHQLQFMKLHHFKLERFKLI